MKTLEEIIKNADYKRLNAALTDRAVELALKLKEALITINFEGGFLGGCWLYLEEKRCSVSTDYFLYIESSGLRGCLSTYKSYYYGGDFNCWVSAATSKLRLIFLNNAKNIFAGLEKMQNEINAEIEKALEETKEL